MDQNALHTEYQERFFEFAQKTIAPHAGLHDRSQRIAEHIVPSLAKAGYLAPFLPERWGGSAMDMVTLGILHEETGRACSSVRSLLTVHGMASQSIWRWGSEALRERWLRPLATGEVIGAFAISEPNAGSDVNGIETVAEPRADGFLLNGKKKWITFGQIAGVYVVLTKSHGKPTTFVIERDRPGFSVTPIHDVFGTRGSMLGLLNFEDCFVPTTNMLGRPGFGANPVALSALGLGRYSVACGSLGIAQACLDASYAYAGKVQRFGASLREHQLIQQMMTQMITDTCAARLLCREAGRMKDDKDPQEIQQTFIAKYFASTAAMRAAGNAVQIHGANGCSPDYPVERYMRDAKVMEIIEGSTQIQEITIASLGFQEFERQRLVSATVDRETEFA
jgi:alkylation response protein AidB-like acyl-CoA dehydrogenase